ncbi:hypothetical protein GHT06_010782 [Daphnia sinensis]|uniref:Uncharacterized protein n=1 Tax=Daphnia sinensis TaxID=1820382 RepID=A0AAD5Q0R6_9CRUS|nr:hypothetical protein GHT06_010782 [Daphnia sinensis]
MPRRLEIRTTILEKKSDVRARGKDANSNDLYADEALQLLEEIQQLKSNIQKTDERILGTYVKSPSKRKKKSDVPARKVAYDVLYPAIGKKEGFKNQTEIETSFYMAFSYYRRREESGIGFLKNLDQNRK